MTIKEKTLKRLECQEGDNADELRLYGRVSLYNRLQTEYLKGVLKDLERLEKQDKILEILKPYFKGAIFPSAINFNFSPEELNLLKKEWLDNAKQRIIKKNR